MSAPDAPVEPAAPVDPALTLDPAHPTHAVIEQRDLVLETRGITKRFGAVVVLRGVDMQLARGEVLGLVGDNGAGKSTFVKIICGFQRQDDGQLFVEGEEVTFSSVEDARAKGIETVYQDLALIPQLSVYQNLFLNRELTFGGRLRLMNNRKMRTLARQYLDEIKVNVPNIDAEVDRLSGGQRQAIAVARATRTDAKILLLDEPLAAMGAKESALIIDLVQDLSKNRGVSIVVIDHNYAHLFELCDRVNVFQQGRVTFDRRVADTSLEELTELMVSDYRRQVMMGQAELQGT
jgi:ABC-type sugar transport system ATPase subunit